MVDDVKRLEENYVKFLSLVDKLDDSRKSAVLNMLNDLGDRLVIAPASHKTEYHSAYPGGLVEHSLFVCMNLLKLVKLFAPNKWSNDTLILVSLFHDLGKVGNEKNDFYIPQDSDWHKERGMMYKFNENLEYMTHAQRSLYMLQHYNIPLSQEEYIAILVHDGQYAEENRKYAMKEGMLATMLHQADIISVQQEKEKNK